MTLAVAAFLTAGPVAGASCYPKTNRNCFAAPAISFRSVPDISKKIVGEEPKAEKPVTQTLDAPPITTYTGPTVGVDSMVHAPTVGYYWSLDPDTDTH